jgi:preprotein translocase subunit SecA
MEWFKRLFHPAPPSNVQIETDRVWLNTDAKFAGLKKELDERPPRHTVAILLVAHFPDVLARLRPLAESVTAIPVHAVTADQLSPDLAPSLSVAESATLDVVVAERHPLPSVDAQLVTFVQQLPCRVRLVHHISLEDPLLQRFAGSWVQTVLAQLGLTEQESIQSPLIVRRLQEAQRRIAEQSHGNLPAASAEEWLEKNCRK